MRGGEGQGGGERGREGQGGGERGREGERGGGRGREKRRENYIRHEERLQSEVIVERMRLIDLPVVLGILGAMEGRHAGQPIV